MTDSHNPVIKGANVLIGTTEQETHIKINLPESTNHNTATKITN